MRRHNMVTRTFTTIKYEAEIMDKTGYIHTISGDIIAQKKIDDKDLREELSLTAMRDGKLLISLKVLGKEEHIYGRTPEDFIKGAIILD